MENIKYILMKITVLAIENLESDSDNLTTIMKEENF
jgi:hypothetical protein